MSEKRKPTIIKNHGGFPMVVPAIKANMLLGEKDKEITTLTAALDKACLFLYARSGDCPNCYKKTHEAEDTNYQPCNAEHWRTYFLERAND